jgi:hypothetical protein
VAPRHCAVGLRKRLEQGRLLRRIEVCAGVANRERDARPPPSDAVPARTLE